MSLKYALVPLLLLLDVAMELPTTLVVQVEHSLGVCVYVSGQ